MKTIIFVEGISDERLIKQYCRKLQEMDLVGSSIEIEVKSVNGWATMDSNKGEAFRNNLKRNKEGNNLLIFDADKDPITRREEILGWKKKYGIDFELFLFPNDSDPGTVETLLERIINPSNQCIIDCWHEYENNLRKQIIPWKSPTTPTSPSEKSKIYGYLEALVGESKAEKEKIKDSNRDFAEVNHWDLNASGIQPLREFLIRHLGRC